MVHAQALAPDDSAMTCHPRESPVQTENSTFKPFNSGDVEEYYIKECAAAPAGAKVIVQNT